jgi:hypothetical protein
MREGRPGHFSLRERFCISGLLHEKDGSGLPAKLDVADVVCLPSARTICASLAAEPIRCITSTSRSARRLATQLASTRTQISNWHTRWNRLERRGGARLVWRSGGVFGRWDCAHALAS